MTNDELPLFFFWLNSFTSPLVRFELYREQWWVIQSCCGITVSLSPSLPQVRVCQWQRLHCFSLRTRRSTHPSSTRGTHSSQAHTLSRHATMARQRSRPWLLGQVGSCSLSLFRNACIVIYCPHCGSLFFSLYYGGVYVHAFCSRTLFDVDNVLYP